MSDESNGMVIFIERAPMTIGLTEDEVAELQHLTSMGNMQMGVERRLRRDELLARGRGETVADQKAP